MTTNRDHDPAIETLLRQSLAEQGRSGASAAHLNPETLAAWADGGLSAGDLAVAEAHAADCTRCQAMLAALARTAGLSPAPLSWWRRGWNPGWLVPLAAGAAALAIWVAVPNRPGPASFVQETPRPAATAEPAESAKSAAVDKRADSSAVPPAASAGRVRVSPPAVAQAELLRDQANAAPPPDVRDRRQKETAREEKSELAERFSAVDSVGRLATPAAPVAPARPAPVTAPPAPAAPAPAAAARALAKDRASAVVVNRADQIVSTQAILSSDPLIRWRVGRAGLIQRSADGGSTWEVLPTGVAADLLGGSSSSPSVCWVAGRAGTVLRTVDGRRFERVPFPENVDLAAVRATDAQTVVVTTIDGRAFRSADGGTTWIQNR